MGKKDILVGIVPTGNVGGPLVNDIIVGIKEVLNEAFDKKIVSISCRVIPPRPKAIPASAYNNMVGSYNIEPFFDIGVELREMANKKLKAKNKEVCKVLVITNVALYSYVNNCRVFGEAIIDGDIAVVSIHQINNNARVGDIKERTIKESIHELGHTFGLRHCQNDSCVMKRSKDMYEVDAKSKYFCEECKKNLESFLFSKEYRTWEGP